MLTLSVHIFLKKVQTKEIKNLTKRQLRTEGLSKKNTQLMLKLLNDHSDTDKALHRLKVRLVLKCFTGSEP